MRRSDSALILKGEWETLPLFVQAPVRVGRGGVPAGFALEQNYPNPVSLSAGAITNIRFSVPGGQTRLSVYNILGKLVKTLVDGALPPGVHDVQFAPSRLAAGTYLYRLQTSNAVETRSMVVVR